MKQYVKCPNCKRTDFVTTMKFQPDATPNGSFVHCLLPYHIDWLCTSTTTAAEMTCPECLAQLVRNGKLLIVEKEEILPIETPAPVEEKPVEVKIEASNLFICDICGKKVDTAIGLKRHKLRRHKN